MTASSHRPSPRDVRMRGFQHRAEVADVQVLLASRVKSLPTETCSLTSAYRRVLAEDVVSNVPVPAFARAAMDGYALRAEETFGASPYNPLELNIIGESFPGRPYPGRVEPGQAVRIMTGSPLPDGADAVLQAEATEEFTGASGQRQVRLTEPVAPAKNVGRIGEDIAAGSVVLIAGRVLRPQDLGVLASIGVASLAVIRQPSVAIFVTGDELLPCGSKPKGYRIVDSNSIMLRALIERDGSRLTRVEMIADKADLIRTALTAASEDVILVSGGSSVGLEDHAPRVLAEIGELPVHGVALRPASPTGVGFLQDKPVFLLPGNPVSCLCAYDLFAGPVVRQLGGRSVKMPYRQSSLPLGQKISSAVGRVDYVRVQVRDGLVKPLAISGAGILSSTTRADGFVLVPADLEGYGPGEMVRVFWYDEG
jgi:molybdopterin molybdotransferase